MDNLKWILGLITLALTHAKNLVPLPNYRDGVALRSWLTSVAEIIEKAAKFTEIKLDDQCAALLRTILMNDDVFAAFHVMLVNLLTDDDTGQAVLACPCPCPDGECPEDVRLFAEKAGFNPLIILSIVQAVITVIKIIKDLKTDELPTT